MCLLIPSRLRSKYNFKAKRLKLDDPGGDVELEESMRTISALFGHGDPHELAPDVVHIRPGEPPQPDWRGKG